jgi:hypothetical protein
MVELADWVADTAGASLAVLLYTFWPAYRRLLEWSLPTLRRPARARTAPASPVPSAHRADAAATSSASAA